MTQVHHWLHHQLTCSPASYHCATGAPQSPKPSTNRMWELDKNICIFVVLIHERSCRNSLVVGCFLVYLLHVKQKMTVRSCHAKSQKRKGCVCLRHNPYISDERQKMTTWNNGGSLYTIPPVNQFQIQYAPLDHMTSKPEIKKFDYRQIFCTTLLQIIDLRKIQIHIKFAIEKKLKKTVIGRTLLCIYDVCCFRHKKFNFFLPISLFILIFFLFFCLPIVGTFQ